MANDRSFASGKPAINSSGVICSALPVASPLDGPAAAAVVLMMGFVVVLATAVGISVLLISGGSDGRPLLSKVMSLTIAGWQRVCVYACRFGLRVRVWMEAISFLD